MRTSIHSLSVPILLLLQLAPTASSAFLLPPYGPEKVESSSQKQQQNEVARIEQQQVIIQPQRDGSERKGGNGVGEGRYSYLSATTPVRANTATAIITSAPSTTTSSQQQQQDAEVAPAALNTVLSPPPRITYVPFSDPSANTNNKKSQNRNLLKRIPFALALPNPFPQGQTNSGIGNQGQGNSGNYNCGNFNSGNYNAGNGNSGSYNNGNGNSGNGNNANGQSGNGNNAGPANNGQAPCGNVVISSSYAVIYQAPSTVYYNVPAVTTTIVVQQQPQVYVTSCYVVTQAAQQSVVYYTPIVQPINNPNYQYPRGCAYWAAQGYRCAGAGRTAGDMDRRAVVVWGAALGFFWVVIGML